MPFPSQTPVPYDTRGVTAMPAGVMGCYCITTDAPNYFQIYIGKSEDIRRRLLEHLAESRSSCISRSSPKWAFIARAATVAQMDEMEKALIREYDPPCNRKVG